MTKTNHVCLEWKMETNEKFIQIPERQNVLTQVFGDLLWPLGILMKKHWFLVFLGHEYEIRSLGLSKGTSRKPIWDCKN
jgi:hypothetical protein